MHTQTKSVLTEDHPVQVSKLDAHEEIEAMCKADEIVALAQEVDRTVATARAARARYNSTIDKLPKWMKEVWRRTGGANHSPEISGLWLSIRN